MNLFTVTNKNVYSTINKNVIGHNKYPDELSMQHNQPYPKYPGIKGTGPSNMIKLMRDTEISPATSQLVMT